MMIAGSPQVDCQDGFCFALLKVSSHDEVDIALRQLAAIQLKNTVKRRWSQSADSCRKNAKGIPDADRRQIMMNLHECVVRCGRCSQMSGHVGRCPCAMATVAT